MKLSTLLLPCLLALAACDGSPDDTPTLGFEPDPPVFAFDDFPVGDDRDRIVAITNLSGDHVDLIGAGLEDLPPGHEPDYALYYADVDQEATLDAGPRSDGLGAHFIISEGGEDRFPARLTLAPGQRVAFVVNATRFEGVALSGQVWFETGPPHAGRFTVPIVQRAE